MPGESGFSSMQKSAVVAAACAVTTAVVIFALRADSETTRMAVPMALLPLVSALVMLCCAKKPWHFQWILAPAALIPIVVRSEMDHQWDRAGATDRGLGLAMTYGFIIPALLVLFILGAGVGALALSATRLAPKEGGRP